MSERSHLSAQSYSKKFRVSLTRIPVSSACCAKAEITGLLLSKPHVHDFLFSYVPRSPTPEKTFLRLKNPPDALPVIFFSPVVLARLSFLLKILGGKILYCKEIREGHYWLRTTPPLQEFSGEKHFFKKSCCLESTLRGMLIGGSYVADPAKKAHIEVYAADYEIARKLAIALNRRGLEIKLVRSGLRKATLISRKRDTVMRFFALIGALDEVFMLEKSGREKDIKTRMKRRVNFETAALQKAANTAALEMSAIEFIYARGLLDTLPKALKEIATARLKNPFLSHRLLGKRLQPPLSLSAVTARTSRLLRFAREHGFPFPKS